MRWESSGVVGFDLGPLLQGQMRIAKLKSAYNSLIIGPRGFGALSLRWIQFASVLRCARSSFHRCIKPGLMIPSKSITVSGFWTVQKYILHFNVLQLKAVCLALKSFQDKLYTKEF